MEILVIIEGIPINASQKFIKLEHNMSLYFNTKGWHHPENLRTFWFYDFHFLVCHPTVT